MIIAFTCAEEHTINWLNLRSFKINTINYNLLNELSMVCKTMHKIITTRVMQNKKYILAIKYAELMKSEKMKLSLISKYVMTVPKRIEDTDLKNIQGVQEQGCGIYWY